MNPTLLTRLRLPGFLSFGPTCNPVDLLGLNVLIGPNGVGKSNLIEALQLLHATPTDFSEAIRLGGLPSDWVWHGTNEAQSARIEATLSAYEHFPEMRYAVEFTDSNGRLEITDELLEESQKADPNAKDVRFYYRFQRGRPAINMVTASTDPSSGMNYRQRALKREAIDPQQSILSQKKDEELYPEVTQTGVRFRRMQLFREWRFGRSADLRSPQPANLPNDQLLPQLHNLGLVLNDLEHKPMWDRFTDLMTRFLPRFKRLTTRISAGSVQVFLHETGLASPTPATRLSDGTLRFLTLLAILLNPESSTLICVEEPELGLHPDALPLLAELMIEASNCTQVVVTTHSDALVSEFSDKVESVLVCDYGPTGTECKRLDADKLSLWLNDYQLGEIWRLGKVGGNL